MSATYLLIAACLVSNDPASARRGNTVFDATQRRVTYDVAASARLGLLAGGGDEVVSRLGFGFAGLIRAHLAAAGRARLGFGFVGGHTRFSERHDVALESDTTGLASVTRVTLLSHSDLALGPSVLLPLSPVVIEVDPAAGVVFSTFRRPRTTHVGDDEVVYGTDLLLRAGLSVGVPVRGNQGVAIGAAFSKIFSSDTVVVDAAGNEGLVFDMLWDMSVSYQMWF
ncbi:MAG: hypothetical protein V3V08_01450 [Nannocystaceae bacterium]